MPINRGPFNALVDDDGTGLTGTVWNKAQIAAVILDPADAAYADLAAVNQDIVFGSNHVIRRNTDTGSTMLAGGAGPDPPNGASVRLYGNGAAGTPGAIQMLPGTAATAGIYLYKTGGIALAVNAATGQVAVGSLAPAAIASSVLSVWCELGTQQGLGIQTTSAALGSLQIFFNEVGGIIGSIGRATATTVVYNTTSDRRLKTDHGLAQDVSGLRAVEIHDFAWTKDGTPDRGIFAQDAVAVFPRAITPGTDATTPDGGLACPWMADYSRFVPDLIVGWQQHDAQLTDLAARLAALERSATS